MAPIEISDTAPTATPIQRSTFEEDGEEVTEVGTSSISVVNIIVVLAGTYASPEIISNPLIASLSPVNVNT